MLVNDVFVSYSRRDNAFVRQLIDALHSHELELWIDWEDIPTSAEWWQEIYRGILTANTFLFVLSNNSLISSVCNLELATALQWNKKIIPVVVEEIQLDLEAPEVSISSVQLSPDQVAANWELLKSIDWVHFQEDNFQDSLSRVMKRIQSDQEHIRMHTLLLAKAIDWSESSADPHYLLDQRELLSAQTWLANSADMRIRPTPLHREYILASQQHIFSNRVERLQRGLYVSIFAGIMLALVVGGMMVTAGTANTFALALLVISVLSNLVLFIVIFGSSMRNRGQMSASAILDYNPIRLDLEKHVFISYSRKDTDLMKKLCTELKSIGLKYWTDESLTPGTPQWELEIERAIQDAGCLTVLLSPDANDSEWVRREIAFADTFDVRIFPLLVRGDDRTAIPARLITHQRVDGTRDFVQGAKVLIAAIMEHLAVHELEKA